jgi:predicted glycoside hydrolase/deacetylase ChbG (UPF0249 family)
MRVIINADDLGISSTVNYGIMRLISDGKITSSTIIANAPATGEAVAMALKENRGSFGVHLNLTQFKPLNKDPCLSPILDEEGFFRGGAIREVPITSRLRTAVFEEWSAQIQHLISLGHMPSHIDSHHHVHTVPGLFPVLKRVQRKFGIRRVRISMNIYGGGHTASRALLASKALWNMALRRYYSTVTTERFTSFEIFHKVAETLPASLSSVELMVHPGDPYLEPETELLTTPWRERLNHQTQLISYKDL